ncbi:MAG TPA: hypothetical protein VJY83_06480 [Thiopseudomonas sp.]|nr:hypothetical protein [Thiopseudomonas sp.]
MRNDSNDLDTQPHLNNDRIEPQLSSASAHSFDMPYAQQTNTQKRSTKGIAALSVLTISLVCASAAFGWWSLQRMQLLEQQLIATQDSFSKTSEDATGRINEITGKVSATHNNVLSENKTLKQRLEALEVNIVDLVKQQQLGATELQSQLTQLGSALSSSTEQTTLLQSTLDKQQKLLLQHTQALSAQESATAQHTQALTAQKSATAQHDTTLAALESQLSKNLDGQQAQIQKLERSLAAYQEQLAQIEQFSTEINSVKGKLTALQSNSSSSDELTRLQQDVLILRSELDNRPAVKAAPRATPGPSLADFDAYRAQTNRTISALQEQLRNLQKNTP